MELQSQDIKEIAKALNKAQSDLKPAIKDSKNPFFNSKYADLGSAWDACRDLVIKNDMSIAQQPTVIDGKNYLATTLMHTSGQWLRSYTVLNPTKNDPQGLGSAITYARRYSLMAMVGVCPEDDDGNAASQPDTKPSQPETKTSNAQPEIEPVFKTNEERLEWLKDSGEVVENFTDSAALVSWENTNQDKINALGVKQKEALKALIEQKYNEIKQPMAAE